MKIFKLVFVECTATIHTWLPAHQQHKSFVPIRFSGSCHVMSCQRKLAANSFSVVLPAPGLISLQQRTVESNKPNFMMK